MPMLWIQVNCFHVFKQKIGLRLSGGALIAPQIHLKYQRSC